MGLTELRQVAAALCIVVGVVIAIVLVVHLGISISHKSYDPWWFWLGGVLAVGVLGIVAGILLGRERWY
jgi:uncharacterized membrane-anchored protein